MRSGFPGIVSALSSAEPQSDPSRRSGEARTSGGQTSAFAGGRARLVAVVAAVAIAVAGCGGGRGPVDVSLAQLVAEEEAYLGRLVRTRGVIRAFGEDPATRHYVVEDERANRVQILPDAAAAEFEGRRVVVEGVFGFDQRSGRFIRAQRIEPLRVGQSASGLESGPRATSDRPVHSATTQRDVTQADGPGGPPSTSETTKGRIES